MLITAFIVCPKHHHCLRKIRVKIIKSLLQKMLLSAGDLDYSNRQVYFKHITFSRAMMAINLRGKAMRWNFINFTSCLLVSLSGRHYLVIHLFAINAVILKDVTRRFICANFFFYYGKHKQGKEFTNICVVFILYVF